MNNWVTIASCTILSYEAPLSWKFVASLISVCDIGALLNHRNLIASWGSRPGCIAVCVYRYTSVVIVGREIPNKLHGRGYEDRYVAYTPGIESRVYMLENCRGGGGGKIGERCFRNRAIAESEEFPCTLTDHLASFILEVCSIALDTIETYFRLNEILSISFWNQPARQLATYIYL